MKSVKLMRLANHFRKIGIDSRQTTLLSTMPENTINLFLTIKDKKTMEKMWYFYVTNNVRRNQNVDSVEIFQMISSSSPRQAKYASSLLTLDIDYPILFQMVKTITSSSDDIKASYAVDLARNYDRQNPELTLKLMEILVNSKSSELAHYGYLAIDNAKAYKNPNFLTFVSEITNALGVNQALEAYQMLENEALINHPKANNFISIIATASGREQAFFTGLLLQQEPFLNHERGTEIASILATTKLGKAAEYSFQLLMMSSDENLEETISLIRILQGLEDELKVHYIYTIVLDEDRIKEGSQLEYAKMFANNNNLALLNYGYQVLINSGLQGREKRAVVESILNAFGERQAYYAARIALSPVVIQSGNASLFTRLIAMGKEEEVEWMSIMMMQGTFITEQENMISDYTSKIDQYGNLETVNGRKF